MITQRRGEDTGPVLHQEPDHRQIVTRCSTMQRRPSVRVGGVDVATEFDQKPGIKNCCEHNLIHDVDYDSMLGGKVLYKTSFKTCYSDCMYSNITRNDG